jgi:hypothetical protein
MLFDFVINNLFRFYDSSLLVVHILTFLTDVQVASCHALPIIYICQQAWQG